MKRVGTLKRKFKLNGTDRFSLLTAQPQACAGLVLHVVFFFLTAQPQACAGLVLHVVFFFFFF